MPGKTCFLNIQWKQKSCSPKCVFCPPRNLKTWLRPCSVTDRRRPHKRLSQIRTWQAFRFLFFPNSPSKTHRQRAVYSRCADKSLAARHLTRLTRSSCAETDLPANSIFHGRSWSAFKYAAEYISTHISMVVFFLMLQIFISLLDAPLWRHPYGLVAFVSYRACPPHPIKRRFAIRANNVQSVHSSSLCLSGGSRFFFLFYSSKSNCLSRAPDCGRHQIADLRCVVTRRRRNCILKERKLLRNSGLSWV